jgi:gas vesicle protein
LSDANIRRLELEVEAARAKLATDLSRLRSPAAYADLRTSLKQEAQEAKDLIVDQAKSTTQSALQDMVDDLKAKAAANPAATLAIGAGIAWRAFRHPPIATALIGAGLFSLLRTPPARVSGNGTADYFSHAKERLKDQATDLAAEVKDQAAVIAGDVKDHAFAMAEAVKEQSAQLAGASKEKVRQWSADVEGAVRDVPDQAASLAHQASRATQSLFDQDTRDSLLLGTASLAVLAALGVAYQRRNAEFDSR